MIELCLVLICLGILLFVNVWFISILVDFLLWCIVFLFVEFVVFLGLFNNLI